jgi:hypothetical protein
MVLDLMDSIDADPRAGGFTFAPPAMDRRTTERWRFASGAEVSFRFGTNQETVPW